MTTNNYQRLLPILSLLTLVVGLFSAVTLIKKRFTPTQASLAPVEIEFSPSSINLTPGTSQTVNLILNPENQSVVISKIRMEFDETLLTFTEEVQTTNTLARVIQKTSRDQADESGIVQLVLGLDPADKARPLNTPTTLATFTLTAKPDPHSQTTQITLPEASLVFVSRDGILLNSTAGELDIDFSEEAPTPTLSDSQPTATPTSPPQATGAPNQCSGTCGSNRNCRSDLYCFFPDPQNRPHDGYCRNPSCPLAETCGCPPPPPAPTSRPVVRPTTALLPTLTPTRQPTPTSTLFPTPTRTPIPTLFPTIRTASPSPTPIPLSYAPDPEEEKGFLERLIEWLRSIFGR